jgi:hypothetical protein
MTNRQKEILHNLHLFELEKAERMKSFSWRARLFWYNFKKKLGIL